MIFDDNISIVFATLLWNDNENGQPIRVCVRRSDDPDCANFVHRWTPSQAYPESDAEDAYPRQGGEIAEILLLDLWRMAVYEGFIPEQLHTAMLTCPEYRDLVLRPKTPEAVGEDIMRRAGLCFTESTSAEGRRALLIALGNANRRGKDDDA